jgi:hypothetical protein
MEKTCMTASRKWTQYAGKNLVTRLSETSRIVPSAITALLTLINIPTEKAKSITPDAVIIRLYALNVWFLSVVAM